MNKMYQFVKKICPFQNDLPSVEQLIRQFKRFLSFNYQLNNSLSKMAFSGLFEVDIPVQMLYEELQRLVMGWWQLPQEVLDLEKDPVELHAGLS